MKPAPLLLVLAVALSTAPFSFAAGEPEFASTEHITKLTQPHGEPPVLVKPNERLTTAASFKPPVEIIVVAKTDSTNLRLSYAADQVIFNWERDPEQLRIDGGPANGQHKPGAGAIPRDEYVTIRWVVLPNEQIIFVNGQLRFRHAGDYSELDQPFSIFTVQQSQVTVKSIKTRQPGRLATR